MASEPTRWRPVAYLAIGDAELRTRVADTLHALGWAVMAQPTGYHLVESLSGWILGDRPWLRVDLIVTCDRLPGCRGATIVRGLRELGLTAPIVVIGNDTETDIAALEASPRVHVLGPELALVGITALARDAAPTVVRPAADGGRVAHG